MFTSMRQQRPRLTCSLVDNPIRQTVRDRHRQCVNWFQARCHSNRHDHKAQQDVGCPFGISAAEAGLCVRTDTRRTPNPIRSFSDPRRNPSLFLSPGTNR